MASKWNKPVTRELPIKDIDGVDGFINVTINENGISIQGKGTSRVLNVNWVQLAEAAPATSNLPEKFSSNKLGWLVDRKPKA